MWEAWQRELLDECRVARLATIAGDGRPQLVPIVFAMVEDVLVTAVDEKPKSGRRLARLRNIERDPRVTVLVDRYEDDWTQLAWVRIEGTGRVVERGGERPQALASLRERYVQYGAMALEELPLIEIEVERVTGWRWSGA